MKVVNLHDAKTHLSRYVDAALAGEDIVIARRDRPLVRLTVLEEPLKKRGVGSLPDLIKRMPDGFNRSMELEDTDPLLGGKVP